MISEEVCDMGSYHTQLTPRAIRAHITHFFTYHTHPSCDIHYYYVWRTKEKNTKEEEVSEKATIINDLQFEKDVEPSIHIGPEVKCDNIDTVTTNNSFDCICCVCTKKVELINR